VTTSTREYSKEGMPLRLFDTRGLEMEQYDRTVRELEALIVGRRRETEPARHLHVAWVCVSEDSRRVEDAESKLVEMFERVGVPVLGVITKSRSDRGFRAQVVRLLPQARNVLRVRAVPEELDDGHMIAPMGLVELAEATMEVLPEGQRNAFAAAQKASIGMKKNRARLAVGVAATTAFAIGATPIPFSDAVMLVPLQVGLIARISAIFGLSLGEGTLATIASSAVTGLGATMLGRSILGGLLKLIPGLGSVAGGAIAGSTAAAMTTAFGELYLDVLAVLLERKGGEVPGAEEVAAALNSALVHRRR
jgi:uncharacterized protein (DUF697 family)